VARFWHDLRVLVVLGVTLLGSISVSVLATGALDVGLARFGLADGEVGTLVPAAAALVLGLGTGFLVFFWILTRLPRTAVPRRGVVQAALVGALGFEVLKQAVALSIGSVSSTPGGAVFGPLLGLLLFCYLMARFALLVSAWAATARGNELAAPQPDPANPAPVPEPVAAAPSPELGCVPGAAAPVPAPATPARAALGALGAAVGVGMLLGAWLRGPRR
jgi:membrane protein